MTFDPAYTGDTLVPLMCGRKIWINFGLSDLKKAMLNVSKIGKYVVSNQSISHKDCSEL